MAAKGAEGDGGSGGAGLARGCRPNRSGDVVTETRVPEHCLCPL